MGTFTVYRLSDGDGGLLYVGCTRSIRGRLLTLESSRDWWRAVASVQLEHYETAAEASAREADLIASEKPVYNVLPGRYPPDPEHPIIFDAAKVHQHRLTAGLTVAELAIGSDLSEFEIQQIDTRTLTRVPYRQRWDIMVAIKQVSAVAAALHTQPREIITHPEQWDYWQDQIAKARQAAGKTPGGVGPGSE